MTIESTQYKASDLLERIREPVAFGSSKRGRQEGFFFCYALKNGILLPDKIWQAGLPTDGI